MNITTIPKIKRIKELLHLVCWIRTISGLSISNYSELMCSKNYQNITVEHGTARDRDNQINSKKRNTFRSNITADT